MVDVVAIEVAMPAAGILAAVAAMEAQRSAPARARPATRRGALVLTVPVAAAEKEDGMVAAAAVMQVVATMRRWSKWWLKWWWRRRRRRGVAVGGGSSGVVVATVKDCEGSVVEVETDRGSKRVRAGGVCGG